MSGGFFMLFLNFFFKIHLHLLRSGTILGTSSVITDRDLSQSRGVTVAQVILVHFVEVRILAGLPFFLPKFRNNATNFP